MILSKEICGPLSRYAITSMATRFGGVEWFVSDAEVIDATGLPAIIRQGTEAECRAFVAAEDAKFDAEWSPVCICDAATDVMDGQCGYCAGHVR